MSECIDSLMSMVRLCKQYYRVRVEFLRLPPVRRWIFFGMFLVGVFACLYLVIRYGASILPTLVTLYGILCLVFWSLSRIGQTSLPQGDAVTGAGVLSLLREKQKSLNPVPDRRSAGTPCSYSGEERRIQGPRRKHQRWYFSWGLRVRPVDEASVHKGTRGMPAEGHDICEVGLAFITKDGSYPPKVSYIEIPEYQIYTCFLTGWLQAQKGYVGYQVGGLDDRDKMRAYIRRVPRLPTG